MLITNWLDRLSLYTSGEVATGIALVVAVVALFLGRRQMAKYAFAAAALFAAANVLCYAVIQTVSAGYASGVIDGAGFTPGAYIFSTACGCCTLAILITGVVGLVKAAMRGHLVATLASVLLLAVAGISLQHTIHEIVYMMSGGSVYTQVQLDCANAYVLFTWIVLAVVLGFVLIALAKSVGRPLRRWFRNRFIDARSSKSVEYPLAERETTAVTNH